MWWSLFQVLATQTTPRAVRTALSLNTTTGGHNRHYAATGAIFEIGWGGTTLAEVEAAPEIEFQMAAFSIGVDMAGLGWSLIRSLNPAIANQRLRL